MQHARILISVGYALVPCGLGFAKIEIERHVYHQYAPQISGIRQFICRRNTRQVLHFGGIKGGSPPPTVPPICPCYIQELYYG